MPTGLDAPDCIFPNDKDWDETILIVAEEWLYNQFILSSEILTCWMVPSGVCVHVQDNRIYVHSFLGISSCLAT